MAKYVCVTKCYHRENLYLEGDIIDAEEGVHIPSHFEPVDKHEEKVKEQKEAEEKTITDLQDELDKMGIPYDKRWGKGSLEKAVAVAIKENKAGK